MKFRFAQGMEADTTQWDGVLCGGAEYELTARPQRGCAPTLNLKPETLIHFSSFLKISLLKNR